MTSQTASRYTDPRCSDSAGVEGFAVDTVDYHTAGEPFRIVAESPVPVRGQSASERRVRALTDPALDELRRLLCHEPRGHADMFGGFVTPADDEGADFGVLFWHNDGFSGACGHGTIALGTWAVESGRLAADPSGTTDVTIDVPSGRVVARVHTDHDRVTGVDFVSVPSYMVARGVELHTSRGAVVVDIAYAGSFYAHLRAKDMGLSVERSNLAELLAVGQEVKALLKDSPHARSVTDPRLSGVYGTILFDELGETPNGDVHQRSVTVFANGAIDRSPCGSGSASRVAVLAARGELAPTKALLHDSILGSQFVCTIVDETEVDGQREVIPSIHGAAYRCGTSRFTVDPHDPLAPGFVLR